MEFWNLWSVVVVTFLTIADFSMAIDKSPCPEVFKYKMNHNGIFGSVTIPIDLIGNENRVQLNVTFVHNNQLPTPYKGHIEPKFNLIDFLMPALTKTKTIRYRVNFPTRDDDFYILSVQFNEKTLCYGDLQPYMGNMYLFLDNYQIISSNVPATLSNLRGTMQIQVNPVIISDTFNKGKRCSSRNHPPKCLTTNITSIYNMYSQHTSPMTPLQKMKTTEEPRKYTSSTEIYSSTSRTVTEPAERANPDNFVKALQQNPNENYNSRYKSVQIETICGKAVQDSPRKWPWATAVYQKGLTKLTVVSSGALLSDIFVITAAAPISKFNNRPTRPAELSVRVGAFDLEDWIDKSSSPKTVREIIYHPDFNPISFIPQNNIALLRITPLKFNTFISPVCLIRANRLNIDKGVNGMTIGWGYNADNMLNVRSSEIAMITLPEDECRTANVAIPFLMTPTTLCARSVAVLPELCQEEPGQGFYTLRGNTVNKWILAGVLSNSIKNDQALCKIAETRLFTDLTKNAVWIETQMYRQDY